MSGQSATMNNAALLFLRQYGVLLQRQQSNPDPERQNLIERLRPLRNKVLHGSDLDESDQARVDSAVAELVDYLRLMESSSLGTAQAQANRLLTTPVDIDNVLQRSHIDPPTPQGERVEPLSLSGMENQILTEAIEGNPQAIGRVLESVRPLVVRYCRARIGYQYKDIADDTAQEVCLAVLTALPSYRDQGRSFMAFVYGIATHKVGDAQRRIKRGLPNTEVMPKADVGENDTDSAPDQRAMAGERTRRLKELLDVLPPRQREIVVLRVVAGLSAEETAEAVGSTPGAVRVAQHRALARLRKTLANEDVV